MHPYKLKSYEDFIIENNDDSDISSDDVVSSVFGHKRKIKIPHEIKIKVKGDTISKQEATAFFLTIKRYLNIFELEELRNKDNTKKNETDKIDDIIITYSSSGRVDEIENYNTGEVCKIDIDYGGGRVVFKRKEAQGSDKIKMILLPSFLDNSNKNKLLNYIDDILSDEKVIDSLTSEYDKEEDDKNVSSVEKSEETIQQSVDEYNKQINQLASSIIEMSKPKPNYAYANKLKNLFLSQRLYVSTVDTNEQLLSEMLTTTSEYSLINANAPTIDLVVDLYKKAPKTKTASDDSGKPMKYDNEFTNMLVSASDKLTKVAKNASNLNFTTTTYESNGLVQDLIYAFDCGEEIKTKNKIVIKADERVLQALAQVNETVLSNSAKWLVGIGLGAAVLKVGSMYSKYKISKSIAQIGISKPSTSLLNKIVGNTKSLLGIGSKSVAKKEAVMAITNAAKTATTEVAKKGALRVIGLQALKVLPWIGIAVTSFQVGSWVYKKYFDNQPHQLASILFYLQYTGSKKIKSELLAAGITIDMINMEDYQNKITEAAIEENPL